MDEKKEAKLTIMLKTGRISIRHTTLKALGDPDSVLLLINPEESALILTANPNQDPRGVKVKKDSRGSMRIWSQALCKAIVSLMPVPEPQATVILNGEVTLQGIRFPLFLRSEGRGGFPT